MATGHSKGRVGRSWGLGPGLPLAPAKGSQTGLFPLSVPGPCPACLFPVWVQQQRNRKFSSGSGKWRTPATSPLSRVSLAAGTRAHQGGIASRAPRGPLGPTGSLLAELAPPRRARMGVMGQKPRTGSFPCLCWKMAAAEATPPAATGEPGAARRASQAPRTACVPLEATLELCGPQAGHGAGTERPGCPRPTPPATTGLPWFAPHTQGPQAALKMIPLGGTVAPEMRPPWRAWPLPPPFVTQKRPREAPGATPASRVGLAPLGCWGSWCVCLWASGGESEYT